jgi:hypothetical protein
MPEPATLNNLYVYLEGRITKSSAEMSQARSQCLLLSFLDLLGGFYFCKICKMPLKNKIKSKKEKKEPLLKHPTSL